MSDLGLTETDSTYGDENSAASTSLSDSAERYKWMRGRRYDKSKGYPFPNDDEEQRRLDKFHKICLMALNDRLFLAPIDLNGRYVLDIGTGTGIWPIDLGDSYPGAYIVGNDLSPIQPRWVPVNVRFFVDDIEKDWVEPHQYDFIHCRYMAGAIQDWPRLIRQIYDNLKPGGWVELQEMANTFHSERGSPGRDYPLVKLMDELKVACYKTGRTWDPAPLFQNWVQKAGFIHVNKQTFTLPVGDWPKEELPWLLGWFLKVFFFDSVESITAVLFGDVLGWTAMEVKAFNDRVRAALKSENIRNIRPNLDFIVVTGQKPI